MRRVLVLLPILLGVLPALGAPPKLVVPADKLQPVAGYVRFLPDTDAKAITYVALDDAYPFPSDELRDARRFVLPVAGLKAGKYRFVAVGTKNDEHAAVPFEVVIGGAKPDDKKDDPKPVVTDRVFWVVTVEESAERTAETARVLADLKFWQEVGKAHQWRHYDDDSEQGKGYAAKAKEKGVTLPALLLYAENAKSGDEPVAVVSLPKTTAGVSEVIKANGGKQ